MGRRMRGGLRQPEENSGTRAAVAGWDGAEEGLEQLWFPMDSPAEAWQDQNPQLPWPGVFCWLKPLPAPEPKAAAAAAVWHRAATAGAIFKHSSGAQAKPVALEALVTPPRVPGAGPSKTRSPSTTAKLCLVTFFSYLALPKPTLCSCW